MKRFLLIPVLALTVFISGCLTTGEADIQRIALGVKEAVRIGTREALRDHPDWAVTFEAVRDSLDELALKEKLTPNDLLTALAALPVAELSSDNARLVMDAARLTIIFAGWSEVEITRTGQVRPVLLAISEGITAGKAEVAAPVARSAAPPKKHYRVRN